MIATQIGSAVVRSKAQEALRQSQANLQTLFDSVGDFLFVLDMQGRILRAKGHGLGLSIVRDAS